MRIFAALIFLAATQAHAAPLNGVCQKQKINPAYAKELKIAVRQVIDEFSRPSFGFGERNPLCKFENIHEARIVSVSTHDDSATRYLADYVARKIYDNTGLMWHIPTVAVDYAREVRPGYKFDPYTGEKMQLTVGDLSNGLISFVNSRCNK